MDISKIKGKPVAYLAEADTEVKRLADCSRRVSKGEHFVLLMKHDETFINRLLPAYVNSYIRHMEKSTRSESMQMEMLLFVAGTMNISKAIKRAGTHDKSRFILFASDRKIMNKFIRKGKVDLIKEYGLELDPDVAGEVAIAGIGED